MIPQEHLLTYCMITPSGSGLQSDLTGSTILDPYHSEPVCMCVQKTEAGLPDHGLWQERGHAGSCVALLQSPFLEDVVLSVADWTWALWLLGGPHTPLLRSGPSPVLYTCATWSCTRPGTCLPLDKQWASRLCVAASTADCVVTCAWPPPDSPVAYVNDKQSAPGCTPPSSPHTGACKYACMADHRQVTDPADAPSHVAGPCSSAVAAPQHAGPGSCRHTGPDELVCLQACCCVAGLTASWRLGTCWNAHMSRPWSCPSALQRWPPWPTRLLTSPWRPLEGAPTASWLQVCTSQLCAVPWGSKRKLGGMQDGWQLFLWFGRPHRRICVLVSCSPGYDGASAIVVCTRLL